MEKLKLSLEELKVESYATAGEPAGAGTVRGHESTVNPDCSFFYTCVIRTCTVNAQCA
jgi:hypothetical protein